MTNFTTYELNDLELGYIFFQARERKKMTQAEVAARAGISKVTICEFENGKQILKISTIIVLCKILDVDLKFCVVR